MSWTEINFETGNFFMKGLLLVLHSHLIMLFSERTEKIHPSMLNLFVFLKYLAPTQLLFLNNHVEYIGYNKFAFKRNLRTRIINLFFFLDF